jgi:ADP-heptose:LPS heptosyltransferase
MTSPMIRAIRQAHPDWTIHAITAMRATNAYAEAIPELDRVDHEDFLDFPTHVKATKLLRLRRRDYEYTILPYPSGRWQYHAGSLVMATGRLISHSYAPWHRYVPGYAYTTPIAPIHVVDLNNRLLRGLNISDDVDRSYVYPSKWNLPPISGRKRIGFHLVSLDSRINKGNEFKSPPLATYAEVARSLRADGYEIAAIGTEKERFVADEFATLCGFPVDYITGTLQETAEQLRDCALVIAAESGIAHLTAAVQVPLVSVFAMTDPARFAPIGDVTVLRPSACPPCYEPSDPRFTCKLNIDFACVRKDLTAGHMVRAVHARLTPIRSLA